MGFIVRLLLFLDDCETRYRVRKCMTKCNRMMLDDPETDRERLMEVLEKVLDDEAAASTADYYINSRNRWIKEPQCDSCESL